MSAKGADVTLFLVNKTPVVMVAAGAVIGGLIAVSSLSSGSGGSRLKLKDATTATSAPPVGHSVFTGPVMGVVEEPVLGGNTFTTTPTQSGSVVAGAVIQATPSTSNRTGFVLGQGQSTLAGMLSKPGSAPADDRSPGSAFFSLTAGQPGDGSTDGSSPTTAGTTTTTAGSNGETGTSTTTTASTAPTTTTTHPSTTQPPTTQAPTTQPPATTTTQPAPTTTTVPPTTTTTKPETQACKDARTQLAKDQAQLEKDQANGASAATIKKDQDRVAADQKNVDTKCA